MVMILTSVFLRAVYFLNGVLKFICIQGTYLPTHKEKVNFECHCSMLRNNCFCVKVFCIFLFLFAASLFGTIIAEINEIVAHVTTKKKDLDAILESYLSVRPR
jgi:hypothetical protein